MLCSSKEEKAELYEELEDILKEIPASEQLYLLGDFNARDGAAHESWSRNSGHFGVGRLNENGQRPLGLWSYHDLCVTNTFFPTKPVHRVSWRHTRSRHWHQLDLVITRRSLLSSVLVTRSYHSADCDTDHSLVGSKVRLPPKRIHYSKQKERPGINISRTSIPDACVLFTITINEALKDCPTCSVEERWNHICEATYDSAMGSFGKKERQSHDWFEAGIAELQPAIETKRTALLNYKRGSSEKMLAAHAKARNNV